MNDGSQSAEVLMEHLRRYIEGVLGEFITIDAAKRLASPALEIREWEVRSPPVWDDFASQH